MDALARAAPPPGSANVGDLYVDQQTRTLWLGVDPAVDPAAFVLISDMLALEDEIDGSLVEAKAYTDSQILTRALLSHTHSASQITDFTAAVTSVVLGIPGFNWVRGMILQWSGSLAEIGVGDLAGWQLCDGSNGTPNLRDKFILGAGNKAVGPPNPAQPTSFNTTGGGTHIHTINGTALTDAQMPSHNHGGITGYISANHTHSFSAVTDAQGNHSHTIPVRSGYVNGQPYPGSSSSGVTGNPTTSVAGLHQHNVSGTTSGVSDNHYHSISVAGSDQAHTHTILGGGGIHEHSISATQLRDTLPWYALAFIMKL
jgi:hypothetical protein